MINRAPSIAPGVARVTRGIAGGPASISSAGAIMRSSNALDRVFPGDSVLAFARESTLNEEGTPDIGGHTRLCPGLALGPRAEA